MNRYYLVFLSSYVIFVFFLTPNVSTGDGGELATASYFLGTAHPSSYPLYIMIGKTFSFLPLGNVAFRLAIMSAVCSALALSIVFWLVFELTLDMAGAIFAVATLFVSYSYFSQSVVAKFYPLNLLLILLVFTIWARRLLENRETTDEYMSLYLTSFLFGLITSNHHTGIIMLGPVFAACLIMKKNSLSLKSILQGFVLFLSGFFINAYLFVRGRHENFFNAVRIDDLHGFYQVITRQLYNGSGTVSSAANVFDNFAAYWYGFKNFMSVLVSNFSIFACLLFIAGCFYLLKKNYRFFAFIFLALFLYGPFLAKLTLGSTKVSESAYYLAAHQYFLPAFALFVVIIGAGFNQIFLWLNKSKLRLGPKIMTVIAVFPLIFLVSRATDSNFRTNFVPYQFAKDAYSVLPADSVVLAFGDNAQYQGWYLKLVGRYREDVCQIASQSTIHWTFQGCNRNIYGNVFPAFFSNKFSAMAPAMLRKRFYGTAPVENGSAYESYLKSSIFSIDYLYYPNDKYLDNAAARKEDIGNFLLKRLVLSDKLINANACLTHLTDDFFTRRLCSGYVIHLAEMARHYSDSSYKRTGKIVKVQNAETRGLEPPYEVAVTEKNAPYLARAAAIQEFNNWKIFYLRQNE